MSKVVSIKRQLETPNDLISFKSFSKKHGIGLTTLYYRIHKAVDEGVMRFFYRGVNKFSESEALRYLNGVC